MNTQKRGKYLDNLFCGLHTVSGVTSYIDMDAVSGSPLVKSCSKKKVKGQDKYVYYLQLNPNKATDQEINGSYAQYKHIIEGLLEDAGSTDFKITRADFSFNSADEDFLTFRKLNKLLICCIAAACHTKNDYETMNLWTNRPLNVAVKNNFIEAENYDKKEESKGRSQSKNRLELRSKRITGSLEEEFLSAWFQRLDDAVGSFKAVQDKFNVEMFKQWTENQEKDRKDRDFTSVTQFILWNKDRIFTRRQLESLLAMIGSKNPKNTAKKLKSKHRIEFFSHTDIRIVVKTLKKFMKKYFSD